MSSISGFDNEYEFVKYLNGKKIDKQFFSQTVVSNELISSTIAKVNRRLTNVERKESDK